MSGGEQEGETLLEICTGPGEERLLLAARNGLTVVFQMVTSHVVGLGLQEALRYGVTALGVDLSEDMIRQASERNSAAVAQVITCILVDCICVWRRFCV